MSALTNMSPQNFWFGKLDFSSEEKAICLKPEPAYLIILHVKGKESFV